MLGERHEKRERKGRKSGEVRSGARDEGGREKNGDREREEDQMMSKLTLGGGGCRTEMGKDKTKSLKVILNGLMRNQNK